MHYFSVKVSESQRKIFNENYKSYFITIDILKLEVDRIRKYSPYYKQYIYAINWMEYYKKKNRNIHKTLDSDFKQYNNENKTRLKNTG